jgi:hypothetical protein
MVNNNANAYLAPTIQIPSSLEIIAITRAKPSVLTVVVDTVLQANTYREGQQVRLTIPYGYGMQQANGRVVKILGVSGSDITVDMDSTLYDAFSVPASGQKPASLAPAGSVNLQFSNTSGNDPFQSLNDIGN